MNDQIMKHFEMKLLWENKRIMNEKGDIIDVYIQPERTSEKDQSSGKTGKLICDVPNTPTKGSESSRND